MTEQWLLVLRAADTAARWHVNQRRKGATAEPYINHLLEVAMLVAEATEGKDAELIMAALLHDAIEDRLEMRSRATSILALQGGARAAKQLSGYRAAAKDCHHPWRTTQTASQRPASPTLVLELGEGQKGFQMASMPHRSGGHMRDEG